MKNLTALSLSFLWLTVFSAKTHAQEYYEYYQGVRALGMGGAAIAVVNDETSLLHNPAGLGKLRDYILTVVDPEVEVGAETSGFISGNALKAFQPQEVLNMLNNGHQDARYHAKAQVFPSFVAPNFGLGILAKYEANGEITTGSNYMEYEYRNDVALIAGFNFRFWDGIAKLGFNARVNNRVEIMRDDITIASNATGLTVDSLAKEGLGVASDVGLILSAPVSMLPTLAVVWRDAGDTRYTLKDKLLTSAALNPDPTLQSVDVALALFPIFGKGTRGTFTVEYRDVLTASDEEDSMKRIHAGFEVNARDAFFFRAGMNQRYWTAGLEIAVLNYQLQMASYGEEIGTAETNLEDRRYVLKFAYRY